MQDEEVAWPLGSHWLDVAWAVFAVFNLAVMVALPEWETVPFHFIWVSLTLLYGFRVWNLRQTSLVLALVILTTGASIVADAMAGTEPVGEIAEVPADVGHVHRDGLARAPARSRPRGGAAGVAGERASAGAREAVPAGRVPRASHAHHRRPRTHRADHARHARPGHRRGRPCGGRRVVAHAGPGRPAPAPGRLRAAGLPEPPAGDARVHRRRGAAAVERHPSRVASQRSSRAGRRCGRRSGVGGARRAHRERRPAHGGGRRHRAGDPCRGRPGRVRRGRHGDRDPRRASRAHLRPVRAGRTRPGPPRRRGRRGARPQHREGHRRGPRRRPSCAQHRGNGKPVRADPARASPPTPARPRRWRPSPPTERG